MAYFQKSLLAAVSDEVGGCTPQEPSTVGKCLVSSFAPWGRKNKLYFFFTLG